jgi:hypothetical protein
MIKMLKIPVNLIISFLSLAREAKERREQLIKAETIFKGQIDKIGIWPLSKIDSKIEYVEKVAKRYQSIAEGSLPDWEYVVEVGTEMLYISPEVKNLCSAFSNELWELLHDLEAKRQTLRQGKQ